MSDLHEAGATVGGVSADDIATRISFVVARDGRIAYTVKNLEPTRHVERTLTAVRPLSPATTMK
ncbi:MAG: hypothetical protein IPG91_11620 [Ideonella sp.]|nr:hypothetical protein [Ideonella sp.]